MILGCLGVARARRSHLMFRNPATSEWRVAHAQAAVCQPFDRPPPSAWPPPLVRFFVTLRPTHLGQRAKRHLGPRPGILESDQRSHLASWQGVALKPGVLARRQRQGSRPTTGPLRGIFSGPASESQESPAAVFCGVEGQRKAPSRRRLRA